MVIINQSDIVIFVLSSLLPEFNMVTFITMLKWTWHEIFLSHNQFRMALNMNMCYVVSQNLFIFGCDMTFCSFLRQFYWVFASMIHTGTKFFLYSRWREWGYVLTFVDHPFRQGLHQWSLAPVSWICCWLNSKYWLSSEHQQSCEFQCWCFYSFIYFPQYVHIHIHPHHDMDAKEDLKYDIEK